MISTISPTTATETPAAKANPNTDPQAAQDRFLKLLVAQLTNQDPMNPLDNAQMTSQMAQISTVTGIQQLNETIKGMAAQFGSLQVLQGSTLVGRDVLLEGNTLQRGEDAARGAFDLAENASSVKVEILTQGGTLLGTVNMGQLAAGRHEFDWDPSLYQGTADIRFRVVARNGR